MGYGDPCENNPQHGPAVVGVGGPAELLGRSKWVCMDCFEQTLANARRVVEHAIEVLADPDPPVA